MNPTHHIVTDPTAPYHPPTNSRYTLRGACNASSTNWRSTTKSDESTDSKLKMPKNFTQPLTCFYWHTYGYCNKPDADCLYAHYPTGVVATAPISLSVTKGPVAGRNAMSQLSIHAEREKKLQEWEARLTAKEMNVNGQHGQSNTTSTAEPVLERIQKLIANVKGTAEKARHSLVSYSKELSTEDVLSKPDLCKVAINAVDGATAAVAVFEVELEDLEEQVKTIKSGPTDLSKAFL